MELIKVLIYQHSDLLKTKLKAGVYHELLRYHEAYEQYTFDVQKFSVGLKFYKLLDRLINESQKMINLLSPGEICSRLDVVLRTFADLQQRYLVSKYILHIFTY